MAYTQNTDMAYYNQCYNPARPYYFYHPYIYQPYYHNPFYPYNFYIHPQYTTNTPNVGGTFYPDNSPCKPNPHDGCGNTIGLGSSLPPSPCKPMYRIPDPAPSSVASETAAPKAPLPVVPLNANSNAANTHNVDYTQYVYYLIAILAIYFLLNKSQ